MTKTYSFGDLGLPKKDMWANQITTTGVPDSSTEINYIKTYKDLLDTYGKPGDYLTTDNYTYNQALNSWDVNYKWVTKIANPVIKREDAHIDITMDDGSTEVVSRAELIKYLSERKLVRENELVRKVYDRYQVAVKLARSDDDGNTGV